MWWYDRFFGGRILNFITRFIFHQRHDLGSTWNSLKWKWDKITHSKKCGCGHPLWMHCCYDHGTCIHGVCLASTFADEECGCDDFTHTTSHVKYMKFLEAKN